MKKFVCGAFAASLLLLMFALPSSAARQTGVLSVEPERVNFGFVPVGTTGYQDIVITNLGTQALQLSSVGFGASGFSTDFSNSTCYTNGTLANGYRGLPAEGTCQLRLTFTPTSNGGAVTRGFVTFIDLSNAPITIGLRLRGIGSN